MRNETRASETKNILHGEAGAAPPRIARRDSEGSGAALSLAPAWRGLLVGIVLLACGLVAPARADTVFHVSPDGNDRPFSPIGTPEKARDLARAVRAQHPHEKITIDLAGGVYFLKEPLVLSPEDSGTADAPLIWSCDGKKPAILSAGRRLTGWQKANVNGHDAWMLKLPADGNEGFFFRELWIDGYRMTRARWPKKGTLAVGDVPKAKTHADWRKPGETFPFHPGDLHLWENMSDGEVVVMSRWVESRLPLADISLDEHIVHSAKPAGFTPETGDRYYLENIKELLTEPDEWYLDPKDHTVYLVPPQGVSSPNDAQVIAPLLSQVLRLQGDVQSKRYVSNVTFRGVGFANNEWYYDHVGYGEKPDANRTSYNQASVGVSAAIVGEGVRNCVFDNCTIKHVGSYGIQLGRACQHNKITHCTVTDLAAGGIKIGETAVRDNADEQTFGNEISDCRITDGGDIFPSAVGVWIGQSHDNVLSHNEIGRFWYTGISIGWTWGYGKALSQNNIVEKNEIHHIGKKQDSDEPILSDMGGIYTLGDEKGTVIRNNIFHDSAAIHYGGWGIYFDEGTTDILAENNLVYRTTHGGFHQHYGKDNVVRNNIFAFGRDNQIQRSRLEDHQSFTFENNIVYWDTKTLLTGNWDKLNVAFDHNTYWHVGGEDFKFAKHTWQQWRDAGMDQHSVIADPGFKNPEQADFHVTADPSKLGGFVPFDWKDGGPRS